MHLDMRRQSLLLSVCNAPVFKWTVERKWIEQADGGNGQPSAMVELGKFFYDEGADAEKAFYWLQNAAGKGDVMAQATIGVMYKTGEGVKEQSTEKVCTLL